MLPGSLVVIDKNGVPERGIPVTVIDASAGGLGVVTVTAIPLGSRVLVVVRSPRFERALGAVVRRVHEVLGDQRRLGLEVTPVAVADNRARASAA